LGSKRFLFYDTIILNNKQKQKFQHITLYIDG